MFFSADQLLAHAWGDFVIQSDWMASTKTGKLTACAIHVVTYSIPFLLLTRSIPALVVIGGTHFLIDHWRLARYVIWFTNVLGAPWKRSVGEAITVTCAPGTFDPEALPTDQPAWVTTGQPPVRRELTIRRISDDGSTLWADGLRGGWRTLRPTAPPWRDCDSTGMSYTHPAHVSFWLFVIVDNIMHVTINAAALRWL